MSVKQKKSDDGEGEKGGEKLQDASFVARSFTGKIYVDIVNLEIDCF